MQVYYIILPIVILLVFLFMMWRDVRTLKSRVTDVVEQHNNIKKVLDKHESMLTVGDPMGGFVYDAAEGGTMTSMVAPRPMDTSLPEIKEEEPTLTEEKPKTKKTKST